MKKAPHRVSGQQTQGRSIRAAGVILAALVLPALFCPPAHAREDSARLVFEKPAASGRTVEYVVQKGDSIAAILRRQKGEEKKRIPYDVVRRLNPHIKDLNRIWPGQKILLPLREPADPGETPKDLQKKEAPAPSSYRIKKDDSISRILLSELDVNPEDALPTYRTIRELNPDIDDMTRLPAGGILALPFKPVQEDPARPAETLAPGALPSEQERSGTSALTVPQVESVLGFVRAVITRMGGTLTARGNYFIPLKDAAQITIDCSLIPVVELDDGATVLLDFGNRLSESVKGIIGQSWPNYRFVPGEELGSGVAGLTAIVRRSLHYTISEAGGPLAVLPVPEIRIFPDRMITSKKKANGAPYRQALFLLGAKDSPLPGEARSFLENSGIAVTEMSGDQAVSGPASPKMTPVVSRLMGYRGTAMAAQLLRALGETPVANAEVVVFDRERSGFTLSITADLLLRKGERQFIILGRKIPDQFVHILREGGTEVIPLEENESGRPLIEKVLQGLRIPVSFGHFSFRVPQEGTPPRLTVTFAALRTGAGGEPLYLIDFELSSDILTLLRTLLGPRVILY